MNYIEDIIERLTLIHGNAACELNFSTPFELLVAVILSAQCTDKRVNEVTKDLFVRYNKPEHYAGMSVEELSEMIYSCGFYKSKARSIIAASRSIIEDFNGEVPSTAEELIKLKGVGIKTANVVKSVAFGGDAIAVDTHVMRVSRRLGLAREKTPDKITLELMDKVPKNRWTRLHHLLVHHGRYICKSRKPDCDKCNLALYCKYFQEVINV
ncbi:MAG: endonuclease III [Christensenellales bacterium]